MDNLSHSVVGLAVGEFIHRSLAPERDSWHQSARRCMLLVSCWLASNFSDLDLLLTHLLPAPLGYLLHHRGHTHTLLYAFPQALLIWILIWLLWPTARRLLQDSPTANKGLAISLGCGLGLHILMDYLNSYGIHPFHPYNSRWFFGDMVFIVEPYFWVAFGIPMVVMIQRRWLKGIWVTVLIGILMFFTVMEFLHWASLALLIILALVLGRVQHKAGMHDRTALLLAAIVSIGFVGVQSMASSLARFEVAQSLKIKDSASRMLDAAMTPFPTNPFCWSFVSIESNERAGTYRLRRGALSLAPTFMPINECPARFSLASVQREARSAITFVYEQEGDLKKLRELKKTNCHFEAWLRFARAPLLSKSHAADLRFASGARGNFATINLDEFKGRECSRDVPGWDFPRADLLGFMVR
ncbi:MAG: metal-dependent hydrolase [Pseudomonadota bacterium]